MATKIRILGWEASGLRCPDHKIDLSLKDNAPHSISLIQMPNGTGKTTVLDLLRAAMSGAAEKWGTDDVAKYAKKNGGVSRGSFTLRLVLDERLMTLVMLFDFNAKRVFYKTTYGAGREEKFAPPYKYRKFMSENFVKFYVFDGELAQQLLDRTKTDAETVVNDLFQISALKTLSQRVEDFWNDKTKDKTAKKGRGYSRRKKKRDTLNDRLKEQKANYAFYKKRKEDLEAELKVWDDRFHDEVQKNDELSKRLVEADRDVDFQNDQVHSQSKGLLDQIREPHAVSVVFAKQIRNLKLGLDRVKLPESAAREFFEELADEDTCVCGRPIDESNRAEIIRRSGQYLGSDDVSLLNVIKTAVDESIKEPFDRTEQALLDELHQLGQSVSERQQANMVRDEIRIEAENSDPEAKKARDEIVKIKGDLDMVQTELDYFFDGKELGEEHTTDLDVLEKMLEKAETKLAEVTETLELKQKRDVLKAILDDAFRAAKRDVIVDVCEDANKQIDVLMPNNHIRIESINKSLILEGQSGGSAGEELSIAYGFLSTLFGRSDHQLPFVVDSPAGPIDLAIRPEIGMLIPKLSGQFIAFTISSERESFVPSLKKASENAVQFITLFRKGKTDIDSKALLTDEYYETKDGIQVIGEEFFNEFQLDKE
jgi:DNA sulfur modification protein DndD